MDDNTICFSHLFLEPNISTKVTVGQMWNVTCSPKIPNKTLWNTSIIFNIYSDVTIKIG